VVSVPLKTGPRLYVGKCSALQKSLAVVIYDNLKEHSGRRTIEAPPCSRPRAVVTTDNLGRFVSVIRNPFENDAHDHLKESYIATGRRVHLREGQSEQTLAADALIVLLRHLPDRANLAPEEREAIEAFEKMANDIANIKEKHKLQAVRP
jgi:hypothetical protein